jgi:hypothetical protein
LFLLTAAAVFAGISLFAVFPDTTGSTLVVSSDPTTLNAHNEYFSPSAEGSTNGQACVTCHQPFIGLTITPPFIDQQFTATNGTDPLFRPNDTANNPFTKTNTAADYSIFLALGTPRIGEKVQQAATPNNFTVVAASPAVNATFASPDMFPLSTDPQHPAVAGGTLSIFRRPIVNVNVNFDSSVLWDGRASLTSLDTKQVPGAIQTLPLGPGLDTTVNQDIANFMTGVYIAQKSDNAAGQLDAAGATGGPINLLALAQSSTRPCVFSDGGTTLTPFVAAVTGGSTNPADSTCTPVTAGTAGFTLFKAWETLSPNNSTNAARLSIARGEEVFNSSQAKCTACHSVPNLGNNPSATFMIREGHDSPALLTSKELAAANAFCAANNESPCVEAQMIQDMIDRANLLPLYCLRPNSDPTPFSTSLCGNDPTDVTTTDPGRALVTGQFSDLGKQKPPVLRDLSVRAPFFHNGDAQDMAHLVNFYNFFLVLKLTSGQEQDLVNFLNAL